jgi:urease accessory protein
VYDAAQASRDGALARAHGAARIELASRDDGRTAIARLGQRSPVRVILPRPDGPEAVAVLLNTAGGVCGGDRLELEARVGAGARATLVGQAAEKIYRALDRPAAVRTRLAVDEAAALHWAPQETLLFDGAMLERRTELRAAEGARLLAAETLVFGRRAMGEVVRTLHLRDDWRLFRGGRLVWADSLRLVGPSAAEMLRAAAGFAGHEALCTLVFVGDGLAAARDAVRGALDAAPIVGGASVVNGVLVARALGAAAATREALTSVLNRLRADGLGFAPALPRVWSC